MNLYVINLDKAVERLAHVSAEFARFGVDIIRVSAVEATELSDGELRHWETRNHIWRPISVTEVACFLSHRKVWRLVLESGEPWSFVCEDDIHLADSFSAFVRTSTWIPPAADLVRAETDCLPVELSARRTSAFGHEIRRLKSDQLGSAGYFISRQTAEKLIMLSEDFCEPLDCLLFSFQGSVGRQLKSYQLDPALCVQDCRLWNQGGAKGFVTQIVMGAAPDDQRSIRLNLLEKIKRELRRLAGQAGRAWRRLTYQSVFKVVPIKLR